MQRINIPFGEARDLLEEGDILLFRSKGIVSFFIRRAAEGEYSHSGVASGHGSNGDQIWECVEFREWKGGRTVNLERYVHQMPGMIDVYRAASSFKLVEFDQEANEVRERKVRFNGKVVTNMMRRMTGLPYGWRRIMWLASHKLPIIRIFYSIDSVIDDDHKKELVYPVCSTAVSHSFTHTGYDLVNNRADIATEPSDLSRSPLANYLFTLE